MKITKHAALLLGIGLALTACGSNDQPSADVALPSPASTSATDEELIPNAGGDETYRADHAVLRELGLAPRKVTRTSRTPTTGATDPGTRTVPCLPRRHWPGSGPGGATASSA